MNIDDKNYLRTAEISTETGSSVLHLMMMKSILFFQNGTPKK